MCHPAAVNEVSIGAAQRWVDDGGLGFINNHQVRLTANKIQSV